MHSHANTHAHTHTQLHTSTHKPKLHAISQVGKDCVISPDAKLGEYDLLTVRDGAAVDSDVLLRPFCFAKGAMALKPIYLGNSPHPLSDKYTHTHTHTHNKKKHTHTQINVFVR